MSGSNDGLGPFGKSFIGEFPTLGTLSLLAVTFLFSALFSLGNIIIFLVLFILSSSLSVYLSYNFIEPHFNSNPYGVMAVNISSEKSNYSIQSFGIGRPMHTMSFRDSIRTCFKKWSKWEGRASRSEYNWFILPLSIFSEFAVRLPTPSESNIFSVLFSIIFCLFFILLLIVFIPTIMVWIRRAHDLGFSGWYILLGLFLSVIFYIISPIIYYLFIIPFSLIFNLAPGQKVTNKYGPIPTNKLNQDATTFLAADVWDLSGSNFSRKFSETINFQKIEFDNLLRRKGPVIGKWQSETKFKTWLIIFIVWFSNYIALYIAALFPIFFIYLSLIESIGAYFAIALLVQWFLSILIILIVLYFEDKLSYLRELFILPNFKQSVILISFISILDLILVIIYVFLYDSIAGAPASESLSEMPLFLLFVALVIAAPLLEEILFRGYLLDKIRNSYSDNFAIMVTGILFGIMHYDILAPLDFAQTGSATIGGFLYAWLRIKTGSLWPSIICHSLWNGTIFFLFFVTYI